VVTPSRGVEPLGRKAMIDVAPSPAISMQASPVGVTLHFSIGELESPCGCRLYLYLFEEASWNSCIDGSSVSQKL